MFASIRRARLEGSQHISLDLFSGGSVPNGKTIILLDEVDHLAGGILEDFRGEDWQILSPDDDASSISGDSGGKAER